MLRTCRGTHSLGKREKQIAAVHIKSGGVADDAGDGAVDALALRGATHNIAVRKVLVDGKPVLNDTREATQAYLRTRISHGTSFHESSWRETDGAAITTPQIP